MTQIATDSGELRTQPLARPVFHIGANKAGSTTLQRALFARHPEVLNLAKPLPVADAEQAVEAILDGCDRRNDKAPRRDDETIGRSWRRAVAPAAADGRVPVYSYEEMIRYQYYGPPDPTRLPKAITAMAGPSRVVIVARHQIKLIESLYLHKSKMARFQPPDQWLKSDPERYAFAYQYHEIADAWARVVGERNVGVFLFEEMVNDTASFAGRLCSFIGVNPETGVELLMDRHENVRKSRREYTYARLRAHLFPGVSFGGLLPAPLRRAWRSYLGNGPPSGVELPADWLRRMEDRYRTDNRKLAKRFGLPLEKYDYPL